MEADRSYAKPTKIDFKLQTDIPSKLPKFVQDLVKEMVSLERFYNNYFTCMFLTAESVLLIFRNESQGIPISDCISQ